MVARRAPTLLLLCLIACVLHTAHVSAFQTGPRTFTAPDTSLFVAAVQWAQASTGSAFAEATRLPIRVDPRPIRSDIEGAVLWEGDLVEGEASVMEHRQAVLQYLDIPQEEALTYYDECLFACDPRLIKPGGRRSRRVSPRGVQNYGRGHEPAYSPRYDCKSGHRLS